MSLKLSDCPPALHDAIMRQLAKEGREFPTTTIRYACATQRNGKWTVGPETENVNLISHIVARLQTQNGMTAYQTSIGNPPAVVLKLTRTTT